MACGGLKYNGIIFGNKRDLMDYLLTGKKPESNITIQEIENDIIKNALNNNDVPTAINDIINVAKIPDNQRSLLNDTFGVDIAQAFVQYVETGNIPSANKNTIRPIFQEILTNINDIVSSVEYSNKQVGSKPIEISTQVLEFTNKIKNNDSQRFIPTGSRSESNGTTGLLSMEKEKWFNPREEGPQGATGQVQTLSERRTTDADNQARGNINRRAGIIGDVKDSSDSEINTTKYSGIPIDGYPERIQLNTGEFISWDADTREWSNVVRNVSGDRWGKLRTASQRERDAAAAARESRIITTESSNDTAVNMIFGQGDPISNISTLNNAGYIDLNPTELYNKLKPQFDNNGINLDQIANVIGTDLYPSLFSIVGENAINNMDNKIVLENLNVAKEMESSGLDPLKIKIATGWERGEFDKKWRYELDPVVIIDNELINQIINREGNETFNYNDLFSGLDTAYPNINKLKIIFDDTENFRSDNFRNTAYFSRSKGEISITINKRAIKEEERKYRENEQNVTNGTENRYRRISRLINHEIQHFIQSEEKFYRGSNIDKSRRYWQTLQRYPILLELKENPNIDVNYLSNKYSISKELVNYIINNPNEYNYESIKKEYDQILTKDLVRSMDDAEIYNNNSGEVEARNAESRIEVPMHVRLNTLLEDTEDVIRDKQVIINNLNEEYDSINGTRAGEVEGTKLPIDTLLAIDNQRRSGQRNRWSLSDQRPSNESSLQRNVRNGEEIYPSNLNNPEKLFSNTGFAPAQTELLTFIHGLIPEAYNKTNTSIEIAIELMYPEQTGFNIMNTLPYTKEEMYDIMTKYENKNIEQDLGSIFIHEYINNDMSFGMKRNKEILDSIINKAKSLQIELPQQYENYFQATTKIKTFFKKGQKLRNKEEILYVHDINYSNPEDITYILWHPQEDAYYEMGLLNMDVFSEDTESDYSKLEDAAINVINALEETGTMVRFVPKLKKPGHFNIFNNEIYLDVRKLSNRLLYHEAAHAAFIKGVRADKETIIKMHTEISNVLRNGTPEERSLSEKLDSFIDRYTETEAEAAKMPLDELRAHEFMAELVAQLSENKSKITKKSEKSIIDKIIEFFRNVLGYNQNLDINNIDDLIDMINGISNKLLTGEKINFSDYNNSISDNNLNKGVLYGLGDIYEGSKAKFFTPGKKIGITMPDGKTSSVIVGLSGTNNNGDGFTELKFPDGKIQRYKTEHLVLREGFGDLFISLMPAADQKANEVHKGNILSNDDKQMLKDFALEKNQAGDYEFSLKDIHSLIKDDVEVDYNVFVDLINSFREEQALKEAKNTDPIGDDAYSDFINNNSVSNDILNSIATKIATRKNLSNREKAIYAARSTEIETIILDYVDQPQPNEPVPPKRSGESKILQGVISVMNSFNVSPEMAEILMKGKDPGDVIKFKSGETIERKSGEAPENSQLAIRFEFGKASEIARGELAKLKDFYGKDVFEKTIDLLLTNQIGQVGTQLMRIVMNQDLDLTLANDESSRPLVKAMKRSLYRFIQASSREAAITLGLSRQLSMTPENMFKSSSVAIDTVLTPESKEARQEILDALEKQELGEDYLDYTARRDQATKTTTPYVPEKRTKSATSEKRIKSDRTRWVPRGGNFLEETISNIKDFITKKCK